ncbi:MAG: hypothetical protein CMD26_05420 [Flavobacteriales bacterium]|nr:hypothetical protein [Flavobacteriales bacterium]|tara:strand:- start:1658 stop:2095 length:438 start_codon:yes stop_codon:yes gene_type:complete
MNKYILIFLLCPLFILSQNNTQPKNYISIGLFDHKTGFSMLGYTRSILQNKQNQLFIGCGSMIALNTVVIGYKKYFFRSFVDGHSTISAQKIYGMAGSSNTACLSIGIEKRIWKVLFINTGVNVTCLVEDLEFLVFPSLNLNIRY